MKKYCVPTLWLIGSVGWVEIAWSYRAEGRMGFVAVQIVISILFFTRAIKGYAKILLKGVKENEKN